MAEVKRSGSDVLFAVDGEPIAGETSCSLGGDGGEIEVSNKSTEHWREYIPGRAGMTASGTAQLIYDDTAETLNAQQTALWNAFRNRSIIDVEIRIATGLSFSGSAFLTSFNMSADDEDSATFDWSVRFTEPVQLGGA